MAPLLIVDAVTKRFGGVLAVDGVSFEVPPGTTLGLVGPNGSGKTTLLNVLNGVYRPDRGEIRFRGIATTGLRPHQLAAAGITRTFQNSRVFHTITVYQNVMVPVLHSRSNPAALHDRVMGLLEFVGLQHYADLPASELSGGQQKLLEFARALMTEPKLVLMDEPFAGVHPEITAALVDRIRSAQQRSTSFIVVSHELPVLMGLSEQVICMSYGKMIACDTPAAICENERVVEAYLGRGGARGGRTERHGA